MISISTSTKFQADVPKITRAQAWKLIVVAANIVRTRAIVLVSKPAKRIRKKRKRDTSKGKKGSQYTVYIGSSRPGEPPQARRTFGRKNVAVEYNQNSLFARLGIRKDAAYMAYLEVGTGRIKPRPWLTRALNESAGALKALRIR